MTNELIFRDTYGSVVTKAVIDIAQQTINSIENIYTDNITVISFNKIGSEVPDSDREIFEAYIPKIQTTVEALANLAKLYGCGTYIVSTDGTNEIEIMSAPRSGR